MPRLTEVGGNVERISSSSLGCSSGGDPQIQSYGEKTGNSPLQVGTHDPSKPKTLEHVQSAFMLRGAQAARPAHLLLSRHPPCPAPSWAKGAPLLGLGEQREVSKGSGGCLRQLGGPPRLPRPQTASHLHRYFYRGLHGNHIHILPSAMAPSPPSLFGKTTWWEDGGAAQGSLGFGDEHGAPGFLAHAGHLFPWGSNAPSSNPVIARAARLPTF